MRNRVKRLLREAFARAEPGLSPDQDIVLVARPSLAELATREGGPGVDAALAELIAKVGQGGASSAAPQVEAEPS